MEEFAGEVSAPRVRRDQQTKGQLYLRGLLLDGRRESMQPMAERLGVDHRRLQQFMTSSTWPVADVRARLAWRAVRVVRPRVWVVDDTGFPKDGTASPGRPGSTRAPWARWATVRSASAPRGPPPWRVRRPRWAAIDVGGETMPSSVDVMGLAEEADRQLHASTMMVPMADSGPGPSGRSTFHQPSTSWYSGCEIARPSTVIRRP